MATFEQICSKLWNVEANIEEKAKSLCSGLEELATLADSLQDNEEKHLNEAYYAPDGKIMTYNDIMNLAKNVRNIQKIFNKD